MLCISCRLYLDSMIIIRPQEWDLNITNLYNYTNSINFIYYNNTIHYNK